MIFRLIEEFNYSNISDANNKKCAQEFEEDFSNNFNKYEQGTVSEDANGFVMSYRFYNDNITTAEEFQKEIDYTISDVKNLISQCHYLRDYTADVDCIETSSMDEETVDDSFGYEYWGQTGVEKRYHQELKEEPWYIIEISFTKNN